jgi:hypothetical protein
MDNLDSGMDVTTEPTEVLGELVPKERVTELIKREKEAAYRKAAREHQAELDRLKTGQSQSMGGMYEPNIEDIYNKVGERFKADLEKAQEESRKADYESFVKGQVDSYVKKMEGGSDLAEDFHETTAKFKPERFKEVFFLANSFDNTPELIYELAKNPYKLANIDYLAKTDPDLAKDQLNMIAKSIEHNRQAKENNVSAEPPLSRPKPSLAAGSDSGAMSVKDYRRQPWLKV